MPDRIRVLIVDDIPETRDHLARLLGFEDDIEVVGEAGSGGAAIRTAAELLPDVVLMDINMPDLDGITAAERLAEVAPTTALIIMSVQGEPDYLRRAMLAGAREFLVKPFSSDELATSIRQVHQRERERLGRLGPTTAHAAPGYKSHPVTAPREPGRIVAFVSPKGGVGRTTIAVNTAVAAAKAGQRVVLVDASLQFGDVGVLLNLRPKARSIADLVPEIDALHEHEPLDAFLVQHSSGISVLLAPPAPEMAELITPHAIRKVLSALKRRFDLVVVDGAAPLSEPMLTILDTADVVLGVLTLEITSIRDTRLFLDVAEQLGYDGRVQLLLNRADSSLGVRVQDAEQTLARRIDHTIVSDGRSVVAALNRGVPFVITDRDAQVSQDVRRLAAALARGGAPESTIQPPAVRKPRFRRSLFAWR